MRISSYLDKAGMALRYGVGLPRFFLKPLSLRECYDRVRRQVQAREENFLSLLRRAVYPNPKSPYYKLLQHAGCEYGDVERMVRQDGLDETLRDLSDAGVYITIEEYKGRNPVQRSGLSFAMQPEDLDNPYIRASLERSSGGTRSPGLSSKLDFDLLAEQGANAGVLFDDLEVYGGSFILYHNIITVFLHTTKGGTPPVRWFLPLSSKKNRLASYYATVVGRVLGLPLPLPRPISRRGAFPVAKCLAEMKRATPRTVVWTTASSAARVCLAAQERGLDISGTHFIAGSEPLTSAWEQTIRAAGCSATGRYAATEAGPIGYGCGRSANDDVHVLKGIGAVISQPRQIGTTGMVIDAFRVTSLLPAARKILINAETGDYGRLETRACGCKFDGLGLTDHLSEIRSFEKLTSEGMTFFAGDLANIIEELPLKFGGHPLDYQAIEEQGRNGLSHLAILVSPKVGRIDEAVLIKTILGELERMRGDSGRMMARVWKEAGTVRVRREDPRPTRGGKVFSFQVENVSSQEN